MYFSAEKRAEIKATKPDMKFGEIQKVIAAAWKDKPIKDQMKWHKMAEEDRERYRQENLEYMYRDDKMKEDESSPPSDQDTEEKGTQNDREQNEVSRFDELLLEEMPNLAYVERRKAVSGQNTYSWVRDHLY